MNPITGKAKRLISSWAKGARLLLLGLGLLAIGLAALLPVAVSFAATVSFSPATNFAVGSGPRSVTVADFNVDGKLDLAVANHFANTVSILLGTGTGSFGAATNFAVGSGPFSVATGDFNGDGKLDLATANYYSANISILLGTGTGSFSAATNLAVGSFPVSVAAGDFNGDGKLDLAVANSESANISILLGTGTGSFGAATNFAVGSYPWSVAVGDFNGDGKLDLAVAHNYLSTTVSILLGTGTGSFGPAATFAAGSQPWSVAVGDFNGDAILDLAVANNVSNNVSILMGTGTGSFGAATNFAVGSSPMSTAVGDFNGDGNLDLAVTNHGNIVISVLLGTGSGTFDAATNFDVGLNPFSVAVGDFNADGKLDLAGANEYSDTVSILLNTSLPINFTLSVSKAGTGSGTVTSSPSGITCGSDCSESYTTGTVVTLTATPASGSSFAGWTGGGCSGTGACTVTMNADASVIATFNDATPPSAECLPTTNPSGKNVPPAGTNPKSGQNPDGFYQLLGSDNVAVASIVVRDSNSSFVSNPFNNSDKVKITQAPGATPSDSRPGPGVIVSELKLKGDGILRVTDTSGNVTQVICRVAPLPK